MPQGQGRIVFCRPFFNATVLILLILPCIVLLRGKSSEFCFVRLVEGNNRLALCNPVWPMQFIVTPIYIVLEGDMDVSLEENKFALLPMSMTDIC